MNIRTVLFYGMIVLIVCLSIYLIYYVKSESFQCISNAPAYAIKVMEKGNNGNVTCSCFATSGARATLTNKGLSNTVQSRSDFMANGDWKKIAFENSSS